MRAKDHITRRHAELTRHRVFQILRVSYRSEKQLLRHSQAEPDVYARFAGFLLAIHHDTHIHVPHDT